MVSLRGGSSIVALLAAATLALGACGDDNKSDSETTGAGATLDQTTNAGTGETGTTGTTTKERTGTREDRTGTRERGDDKGGRERSGSGGGDGSNGGGSDGRSDDSGSTAQPPAQPGNVYKTAKTVCNSFLPKQIEKDLKDGDRKAESVARDYSRGFPEKQQQRAYDGCLAGLKAR
jgi:hypothetical protein